MHTNSITVHKTDGTSPLAGAKFQLFNSAGSPIKRVEGVNGGSTDVMLRDVIRETDASGVAVFNNLPAWAFYVEEIDPPTGYLINQPQPVYGDGTTKISGNVNVSATNALGLATVEILKKGAGGANLDGGKFTLTGTSAYNGLTFTISDVPAVAGKVTFTNVPIGSYTISETQAPAGHQLSVQTITVTVSRNAAKTGVTVSYTPVAKTITNDPVAASSTQVSFTKTDLTGTAIDLVALGGTFVLKGTDHKGNSVNKTAAVTAGGDVSFSDVTISTGKYQIYETVTPTGYLKPNDDPAAKPILEVDVKYNTDPPANTYLVVTITEPGGATSTGEYDGTAKKYKNAPAVTDISFDKKSSANPSLLLNGGQFKISGEAEAGPFEKTAAAVNGVVTFTDVPVNALGERYTIEEIVPPPGYLLTSDKLTVTVSYTDGTETAVATPVYLDKAGIVTTSPLIENAPAPNAPGAASISVLKTDEDGNVLAGAVFTLYGSSGNAIITALSGADGIAKFTNIAPNSSYTIKETKAPEGYELSSETISFTTGDGSVLSFTMVNKKLPKDTGSIRINKVNEDGAPLAGATFTLYDSAGNAIATAVSDADGIASFTGIAAGASYTIRETAAPEGYEKSGEVFAFDLKKDDSLSFTLINRRSGDPAGTIYGTLRILKADTANVPLSGAEFTLYDSDGNVLAVRVTGEDGIVSFTNLAPGTYSVGETRAPAGYRLFEGRQNFEITAENLIREFTLRNTREEEEPDVAGWEDEPDDEEKKPEPEPKLPQTGGIPASFWFFVTGAALTAAGLLGLPPRRRKGKHLKRGR